MNRKGWTILAGAGVLGVLLALGGAGIERAGTAAPGLWIGAGLRRLSLSGWMGNVAAWAAVVLVCALPVLLMLWHRRRSGERRGEDWLLALASVQLFALLYLLVNPTLLAAPVSGFFPLAAGGTLLSEVVAWLVLKLLRGMDRCPPERLALLFRPLLTGGGALLVFSAAFGHLSGLLSQWRLVAEGNTADPEAAAFTGVVLAVVALLEAAPYVLGALALLWGADLAGAMGRSLFGREAVELCVRTAAACRIVVQATVFLAVAANLIQLLLAGMLRSSYFSVSLPLFPLLLSAGLLLLCRCLQRGRELQEDSDSII